MSEKCLVCGNKIRLFKIRIKDGYICGVCQDKLPLNEYQKKEQYTGEEIKEIIRLGEERDNAKPDMFQAAVMKITEKQNKKTDKFEEIREYRRLCDEGLITEEEFEKKKKELLEL